MGSREDLFANLTISPDFLVTLDLDSVENIGHPYWEVLDPTPHPQQLFDRFNKLFFDGQFNDEQRAKISLKWIEKRGEMAAQTWPANKRKPIRIELNEKQLKQVLRKEIVETIIHEMIHGYLIAHNMESEENDYHCENFIRKMNEINAKTNLNITVTHNFETATNWYIFRCRKKCKRIAPFFGFVFREKESLPNYNTPMALPKGTCAHDFIIFKRRGELKNSVSKWDCIVHFLTATKRFVQIKTSHKISQDPEAAKDFNFVSTMQVENEDASSSGESAQMETDDRSQSGYFKNDCINQRSPSQGYSSSHSTDDNDCIESVNSDDELFNGDYEPSHFTDNNDRIELANGDYEPSHSTDNNDWSELLNDDDDPHQDTEKSILEDEFFANFNKKTKTLAKLEDWSEMYEDLVEKFNYLIVCMICNECIDDDKGKIVEHSENCTALSLEENDNTLAIYKWTMD